MPNVTYSGDFARVLSAGISNWQDVKWKPTASSPEFSNYCANITDTGVLFPEIASLRPMTRDLITQAGYPADMALVNQMLNYIGYVRHTAFARCGAQQTQDQCLSYHKSALYPRDNLVQAKWRSWDYQLCTELGFRQTGSGMPADRKPLISRTQDLAYGESFCRIASNITTPPNLDAVNKYSGYDIAYERLAIADGEWDPWRPATPHAFEYGAKSRTSTTSQSFLLIDQGIHCYDTLGLFPNETTSKLPPKPVAHVQSQEVEFVLEWMEQWKLQCQEDGKTCS